ncbi:MAG: bifunctional folylpolyglutamate synthase/dihydrofolate synthase [Clostridia bacterium]|nr:bifunctional folylpolyglutamate synthase/dihydrofolate synthase [Clostridia bacterium]
MLLELLQNPQDKLKFIHIAGTNGKGSTSTMISNMLIANGHKTGLFTSPYVIDFCERIQINGENVCKDLFAECVTEVREKIEELNKQDIIITEFEAITVSAFLCFLKAECEYVVLEVGLGGRFDATNVVKKPEAVVITSISLDHIAILGDTIEKIAFEKCGIIKENTKVITSINQQNDALKVIRETCKSKNCNLIITNPKTVEIIDDTIFGTEFVYKENTYKTKLTGNHQIENTVNAIETANVLGISQNAIAQGIFNTRMIARMEIIGEKPLIIRDGGHNEGCAEALRNFLTKYNVKNINMLIGLMADKDVEGYVQKIAPLCKSVVTVTPSNPRALNAENLQEIAKKYCEKTISISNPQEGYKYILSNTKEDETILVCGSFYMMSDIFGS